MILLGNQRGNAKDMARHLLKVENEKVTIHEISGFVGNDLQSAFQESYALSRATHCSQHLYSLSLNPPKDAEVSTADFEAAIDRAEEHLGLTGQPRAIVFHEKRGRDGALRRHAHCVWCRIDTENMKAIHLSFPKRKLNELGRELYLEHGWDMPRGFQNTLERSKLNYSHAEHQQARRRGKYADEIKRVFQNAWAYSDTKATFAIALKEHGYVLARGDKRSFVAVDRFGEVFSIPRTLGLKTHEVRKRLGELDGYPSVLKAIEIANALDVVPEQSRSPAPAQENEVAKRLKRDPEHLFSILSENESVFTKQKIAKTLSSYLGDAQGYHTAYQAIMASKKLVQLTPENESSSLKARFAAKDMVECERELLTGAQQMASTAIACPPSRKIETAIRNTAKHLRSESGAELSAEQRKAVRHFASDKQLSCVIGVAGAGKSTILAAAREAWEANGQRVFGAALAGKAAKGLEQSSGIKSRTLASMELAWQNDLHQLRQGDVLVIDEAGMIGSRQLGRFISEAKAKGAKLVLVGDAEQLQPIEAGAPFKAITERIQPATLHEVHRQNADWQKQASKYFALGNTKDALSAYIQRGGLEKSETNEEAIAALASDYLNDMWGKDADSSLLALAHRKADVKAINQTIRQVRKEAGELERCVSYQTTHGKREFAAGDRLVFTRNDRGSGVKNGMFGSVLAADKNTLTVQLDDKQCGEIQTCKVDIREYADIEHGYATTIHKSQGATVDRSFVLASNSMDRHLTYVAMTRHKKGVSLYASDEEFADTAKMVASLSRQRQKQSTLDFVDGPSIDLERKAFMEKRRSQSPGWHQSLSLH